MKRIALDTNIAVDILNGSQETIERLEKYDVYYLPIVVCGELLFGAMNSKRKTSNIKKFKGFIKTCKTLNTNSVISEEYANIRLKLKENGTPIPENDIWIASICSINKIPLATRDKHFKNIEKIKIVKLPNKK